MYGEACYIDDRRRGRVARREERDYLPGSPLIFVRKASRAAVIEGVFRSRGGVVETQPCISDGRGRGESVGAYVYLWVILVEVGEILLERIDTCGTEEEQHVEIEWFIRTEVVADGSVHHYLVIIDAEFVEFGCAGVVDIADREQEALSLVLVDCGKELRIVEFAGGREEYLALAVDDIFLQVKGDALGCAEVFGGVGHAHSCLLTETEEVVDSMAARKHNSGIVGKIHLLVAEFLDTEPFYFDKGTKYHFHSMTLRDIVIGGFGSRGFGL